MKNPRLTCGHSLSIKVVVGACLQAGLLLSLCAAAIRSSESENQVSRNTVAGVAYVKSEICGGCHRQIYEDFKRSAMGRSMSLPDEPSQLEKVPSPITRFDAKLNRYFQVFRQGSNLYQSEYEVGDRGIEVFRETHMLEYVIGSGVNGYSYIVRRGDHLFEAPLSFYSKSKTWEQSPGYEFRDYGFNRPIQEDCIACHSGQPQPVPEGNGLFKNPPFRELAVGCENCHGPGELHVRERATGKPVSSAAEPSIVNPAKLPPWLADNICMICHQGGDSRILQPAKNIFDFRPGTPLSETVAIFKVPLQPDEPSPLLEHHFSMMLSKCYREAGGKLGCLTCHEIHRQPSPDQAPAYFRNRCLSCHTEESCALPLLSRLSHDPPDHCVGCHMPRMDLKRIVHSSLTEHRIIAYRGQPYPDAAFRTLSSHPPDLHYLNSVPGKEGSPPPRLTLFQAYGELARSHPAYGQRYLKLLDEVAVSHPDHPLVLTAIARRIVAEKRPEADARQFNT